MFWQQFWANFLSDFLVVLLFGGGTYFLFRNKINQKIKQIAAKGDNININRINVDNRTVRISGAKDSSVIQSEEGIEDILETYK